ncbi:hypothetical protein IFM89_020238 [Coptis chinensis]|uniref:DUF4283 domain-containing protein n=1 Tax=Coptis chinensis TaxID=261450 RepID=A0A835HKT8_9MAGN|nr:hypothetical protein IFM89_020238 [Coptis chinensis]
MGKLYGGYPIDMADLGKELHRIWQTRGEITMELVSPEHVKVVFELGSEYKFVTDNGPWIVYEHIFSVKKWKRTEDIEEYLFDRVHFWVQVWGLPRLRINKDNMEKIGAELGKSRM